MNNVRGLYPPLFGAPANGGGGGGGSIQVDTLPEASLEYKDKIVQYTGATTETLTNGYFYKCVEHTETEGETITVTYSWDNIPVMLVESGGSSITYSTTEQKIGKVGNDDLYAISFFNLTASDIAPNFSKLYYMGGVAHRDGYGYFTLNNGLGAALRADVRPIPNAAFLIAAESGVTIDIVTLHYTK